MSGMHDVRHRPVATLGAPPSADERAPFIGANGSGEDSPLLTQTQLRSVISSEIRQSPLIRLLFKLEYQTNRSSNSTQYIFCMPREKRPLFLALS